MHLAFRSNFLRSFVTEEGFSLNSICKQGSYATNRFNYPQLSDFPRAREKSAG